jgi:hypothetical protein
VGLFKLPYDPAGLRAHRRTGFDLDDVHGARGLAGPGPETSCWRRRSRARCLRLWLERRWRWPCFKATGELHARSVQGTRRRSPTCWAAPYRWRSSTWATACRT